VPHSSADRREPILVREAEVRDAAAMGELMVTTWLAAHRQHIPAAAWERRREHWTPEVSAAGWERTLRERDAAAAGQRDCYLVAEDPQSKIIALAAAAIHPTGTTGEVGSLYVRPDHQRLGIGRLLVRRVASDLHAQGVASLQIGVLITNDDGCRFYQALGGQVLGERLFDEEGDLLPELIYAWPDITTLLQDA
jgi:ribosomal protein S18 acetylase RimI-like enzyme